jgi:peptidoglycan/xylan/chitin deacetylase (PgdA/CDA1 family)
LAVVGGLVIQKSNFIWAKPLEAAAKPAAAPAPIKVITEITEPAETVGNTIVPQPQAIAPVLVAPVAGSPAPAAPAQVAPAPVPTVTAQVTNPVTAPGTAAPAPALAPAPSAAAVPAAPQPAVASAATTCPGNPNALGVSRTVEIDTTGGPGFGFEHFKSHDFLREGEVVLTFDDGPWPKNTATVLAALAAHCTKAVFFPIGLHVTYEPQILKQVAAAGHTIGSHTWCHQDLSKTKGHCLINGKMQTVEYDPKTEIEMGVSAVHWAVGNAAAPFFRFPALRQPPELINYLGQRNIAIFSADFDSFDFKMRKPEQVKQSVMTKLKKHGKGIILMHDFQHATAEAAADLLNELKAGGYRVVFMRPKNPVTTIASYDEAVLKQVKGASTDTRPTSSVVRDVN